MIKVITPNIKERTINVQNVNHNNSILISKNKRVVGMIIHINENPQAYYINELGVHTISAGFKSRQLLIEHYDKQGYEFHCEG